jgi:BirA family transcriptional regulator, biotin operon repressor / biotin---[acetyl-CoA-carboxylase] ligase
MGVMLSWSWRFEAMPPDPGAISLAVGVALVRALASCGVTGVKLKWPNDLVVNDAKLAGILIEMRSEVAGPAHLIVGVGLNLAHAPTELAATDLASLGPPPAREILVAAILNHGIETLHCYGAQGLRPFQAAFVELDALRDRAVVLHRTDGESQTAIARGIAEDGALKVERDGQIYRMIAGEVSVRPDPQ